MVVVNDLQQLRIVLQWMETVVQQINMEVQQTNVEMLKVVWCLQLGMVVVEDKVANEGLTSC